MKARDDTAASAKQVLEIFSGRERRTSLVPALADALRREILEGRLRPGDRLPTEAALGSSAGVSRTVVREAVATLKAEGLVETRQGAGAFVLPVGARAPWAGNIETATVEDILSVLELRMAIEVEAATLAATRRNDQDLAAIESALLDFSAQRKSGAGALEADARFHKALATATRNPRFVACLESLGEFAFPRRHLPKAVREGTELENHLELADREHRAIFEAVRARDAALAASTMRLHLGGSKLRYASLIKG